MKSILVLNQYAVPRSQAGGSRHIDLFGRLRAWAPTIVATSRNHKTQEAFSTDDSRFVLVSTPPYDGNGFVRIFGWVLYSIKATDHGLRLRRVDLVYASSPHLLTLLAGLVIAKLRRVPLIVEIRDLWPDTLISAGMLQRGGVVHRVLSLMERQVCRQASHIVAVTEGWEDHFETLGVPRAQVTVIPNGCEVSDFDVADSRDRLRQRWGIKGTTAVYAGAHGQANGIDLILDAAKELPEINFLLVGAGPVKGAAIDRAARDRLTNVRFMDPVAKTDVAGLLRACDVGLHVVMPLSVLEHGMSPNKLFDYMASGLPVVSNAELPLRRILADGECGRLGGPHDLVGCIQDVVEATDGQRRLWGERGRALVASRFSRGAASERLEEVLNRALMAQERRGGRLSPRYCRRPKLRNETS